MVSEIEPSILANEIMFGSNSGSGSRESRGFGGGGGEGGKEVVPALNASRNHNLTWRPSLHLQKLRPTLSPRFPAE